MNLKPYVDSDAHFNPSKIYPPAISRAFNWDNGTWAIPTGVDPIVLLYNHKSFDDAQLAYPNAQWTLNDLTNAAEKLLVHAPDGTVSAPSFGINIQVEFTLLTSLFGSPLVPDVNTPAAAPTLSDPNLKNIFIAWEKFRQKKDWFSYSPFTPLALYSLRLLLPNDNSDGALSGSLLPGGKAALMTEGFAVSGGTAYPELAYQLATYLATQTRFGLNAFYSYGVFPARADFLDTITSSLSPGVATLLRQSLERGLSNADMLYGDYLELATFRASFDSTQSAEEILNGVQTLTLKNLNMINATSAPVTFSVTQYPDPPPLPPGKIALKLGFSVYTSQVDQSPWQTFADQFAQNDPVVGRVDLDSFIGFTIASAAKQYDCFYEPYASLVPSDAASLLNVDPLLTADPAIKTDDFAPAALDQLTSQGHVWGIPLTISPALLRYLSYKLSANSLALVQDGWDTSAFVDFLKAAKADSGSTPPFGALNGDRDQWLLLVAAFGGLPIDYRTNLPTLNFTAPNTVDAIRQVLDLTKQGYVDYRQLGTFRPIASQTSDTPLIRPDRLTAGFPSQIDQNRFEKLIAYPKGGQYTPGSFTIGAGFISKTAANPDACYRLLNALASRPDLLLGMPARRSLLDSQSLLATQGPDAVAFYRKFDDLLHDPAAVIIPPEQNLNGDTWIRYWLYQAFDAYVLHSADLTAALQDAQTKALGFQECVAVLPSISPDMTSIANIVGCAHKVDPQLQ
ncbi:MAG: type 2 periplasmic-binding domain-containing protein [Aggregatilineales bacterium]